MLAKAKDTKDKKSLSSNKSNRINSLDTIRALSCIGIVLMHIKANSNYNIENIFFSKIIDSFSWLVMIFLVISGFGLCVGYLNKFNNKEIDLESFYKKRFKRILPFFILLILFELFINFSFETVCEGAMESSLLFGFLPNNNLNVIGVSWTLGIICVFYLLFPFLSVFFKTKTRTWLLFLVSVLIHLLCVNYFFTRKFVAESFVPYYNFLYHFPCFIVGALIYHYLPAISESKLYKHIGVLLITIILSCLIYAPNNTSIDSRFFFQLLASASIVITAIHFKKSRILTNKPLLYIGSISFEMYLSHMIVFRLLEKGHMLYLFGNNWTSYLFTSILTIAILVSVITLYKSVTKRICSKLIHKQTRSCS